MIRDTLIVASVLVCLGLAWIGAEWAWLNYVPAPTPIELPVDAFVSRLRGVQAIVSGKVFEDLAREVLDLLLFLVQ